MSQSSSSSSPGPSGEQPSEQLELFEAFQSRASTVDRAGWLPTLPRLPRPRIEEVPATDGTSVDVEAPPQEVCEAGEGRTTQADSPASTPLDLEAVEASMTERAGKFAIDFQLGSLAKLVHVAWNRRMRTAAGRAHYSECRIELNPRLAELANAEEEIERTFLHELAHLVAHHRHRGRKIRAHGPEWRQACADLGIPGEGVYHQLPFEGRKVRRQYAYRCPACGTEFERVRRFRQAVACYECCSKHTRGRYDDRYRLIQRKL